MSPAISHDFASSLLLNWVLLFCFSCLMAFSTPFSTILKRSGNKNKKSYGLPHMWALDQGQTQQGDWTLST
jgi:hypothetical protein